MVRITTIQLSIENIMIPFKNNLMSLLRILFITKERNVIRATVIKLLKNFLKISVKCYLNEHE